MKPAMNVSIGRSAGLAATQCKPLKRHHWQRLPVALACASLCTTALPAIIDWTGTVPVLLASGDFGYGYQTIEFQYGLDWQGFCNAHPTATCTNITYWGVGANWASRALPGFADEVRTPVGSLIVVGSYQSRYHGYIEAFGTANYLNAQGTLAIGLGGSMILGSADIDDLRFSGLLQSDGRINVSSIAGDNGRITGSGTTFVQSIASPSFSVEVRQGQHFTLGASFEGRLLLYGFEQATLENTGRLSTKANNEFTVFLAGNSNVENRGTLSALNEVGAFRHNRESIYGVSNHVHNTGLVEGAFTFDGVRFDNDGTVRLQRSLLPSASAAATTADLSAFLALGGGTHTGRFQADTGTLLSFSGSFAAGHVFLPGSTIQSAGAVIFGAGVASVQGGYSVADTVIGAGAASVAFSGDEASFGTLTVNGNSDVTFNGRQASFGTVTVNSNGSATFATPVSIPVLNLAGGADFTTPNSAAVAIAHVGVGGNLRSAAPLVVTQLLDLDGGTVSHVDVQGALRWGSGAMGGSSVVRGANTWVDGSRSLFGDVTAETDTLWQGGNFTYWSNTYLNPIGRTVNLQGDFGIARSSGRFDNRGTFRKSAGDDTAAIGVAFDNSGSVVVESGTLRLDGGGLQTGTFFARPGAAIVLGGDQTLAETFIRQGRLTVSADSLHLLPGTSYDNGADDDLRVRGRLLIDERSVVRNLGSAFIGQLEIRSGGACPTLCGRFENAAPMGMPINVLSLDNAGTFVNGAGSRVYLGFGTNSMAFNRPGSTIENHGYLGIADLTLSNDADITNTGTVGAVGHVVIANSALITNDSEFMNSGSLRLSGSGRLENRSRIDNSGMLLIDPGASIGGAGSYRQTAGLTTVDGLLQAGNGIFIDGGTLNGLGTVQGDVMLGPQGAIRPGHSPGTLTVNGNLTFSSQPPAPGAAPNLEIEVASAASFDTLRVTGVANLNSALVEIQFLSGYVPRDGDHITWLQAGSLIDNCQPYTSDACLNLHATGLTGDWQAVTVMEGNSIQMEVINDPVLPYLAAQIASADAVAIAAGEIASNWNGDPYAIFVHALDNNGRLYNQPGSWIGVGNLHNGTGGVISNRGTFLNSNAVNDGIVRIRSDSAFETTSTFTNHGEVTNHGSMRVGYLVNENGARLDNGGTLSVFSLTNRSGATVDNSGTLTLEAASAARNEGRFTVSGTLTGGNEILNAGGTFEVTASGNVQGLAHYRDLNGLTTVDGRLEAQTITLQDGVVTGHGTLAGATTFTRVTVQAAAGPGELTIAGDLTLDYVNGYQVNIAGNGSFNGVHVDGQVHLPRTTAVTFVLHDKYLPQLGDSFGWMVADGGIDGSFRLNGVYSLVLIDGQTAYQGWTPPDGVAVNFHDGRLDITAAVPEPAAWLMWLAGGLAVASLARRRRPVRACCQTAA